MATAGQRTELSPELLETFRTLNIPAALAILKWRGLHRPQTAAALAENALVQAESDPGAAQHWLEIAEELNRATGNPVEVQAQILYTKARLQIQRHELQEAEASLRAAQDLWQAVGNQASLARSYLGLTQILTLQGRHYEAETTIRQGIALLPPNSIQQVQAYTNLANLLDYQGEFEMSLQAYATAHQILTQLLSESSEVRAEEIEEELAHLDLNRAVVLISLDRPREAERALLASLGRFERAGDRLNCGRARTNLGSLYLRTGRYAAALDMLNTAADDLLGDSVHLDQVAPETIGQADMLLLDQASVYLALNLLPEAISVLQKCYTLFQTSRRIHELGQTAYLLGLAHLRQKDFNQASKRLEEAKTNFAKLENAYWCNRTDLALAMLDYERADYPAATERLQMLLRSAEISLAPGDGRVYPGWDIAGIVDAWLLRLRLHLLAGEWAAARQLANQSAAHLYEVSQETGAAFPHLRLKLEHALGCLEAALGNTSAALQHLQTAIFLLEGQRASLPMEEFKNAYLVDKQQIYSDLVLILLQEPSPSAVAEAFGAVERARSRALLEQLLISVESAEEPGPAQGRDAEVRARLHWLYNQLLGEDGARSVTPEADRQLRDAEQTLQRLEWQAASRAVASLEPPFAWQQVQPVDLTAFQRTLRPDQQALVYYVVDPSTPSILGPGQAGDPAGEGPWSQGEVLAFVVDAHQIRLVRGLCTQAELIQMQAELQNHLRRPSQEPSHSLTGLQQTLGQLFQWLIAPLLPHLVQPRLLLIPHGLLHLLPFHIFWDGRGYLLEQFTCTYAPSASVAAASAGTASVYTPQMVWAGIAPNDPSIPNARREITQLARQFQHARLYLDGEATRQGLKKAAAQAGVLHIATHSLLRTDNPFFSALKLADGWIDVRELTRLPLNASLVVLSSCRSGSGRIQGGDEVIGLARGFLAAGARALLVSLWDVDDSHAPLHMTRFYQHLLSGASDPSTALRTVQLEAIERNEHPYYWAPFLTIGTV